MRLKKDLLFFLGLLLLVCSISPSPNPQSFTDLWLFPLSGGWLTGKYKRGEKHEEEKPAGPEAGSRIEWASKLGWQATSWDYLNTDHTWGVVCYLRSTSSLSQSAPLFFFAFSNPPLSFSLKLDAVSSIANKREKSMAQVSLRWLMQKPGVTSPIIGARSLSSLNDNLVKYHSPPLPPPPFNC